MNPGELSATSVEHCPFHRPAAGLDRQSATCGLLDAVLAVDDASSSRVTRETCECCCRSFPPTPLNPNPVVSSLLYARGLELAARAGSVAEATRLRTITERARQGLDVVYAEPLTPPPAAESAQTSLTRMLPPPRSRVGRRVRRWALGVTTSPRIQPTLETMLESLLRAGWERPWLFIDSAVRVPEPYAHLPYTYRTERSGAWPNYYLALMELLLRHPRADAYMVIQDDALVYEGVLLPPYLEQVLWPEQTRSLVSLYCGALDTASSPGWHSSAEVSTSGPVAVAFPPELAREFVSDPSVIGHRWASGETEGTSIGDLIALWAHARGIAVWHPTPSLVQHIGDTSTLWPMTRATGQRRASRFAGGDTQATQPTPRLEPST